MTDFARRTVVLGAVAALAAGTTVWLGTATAGAASDSGQQQLAEVRRATAKYHDVDTAIADGYAATDECVPAMGYHFVNFGLFTSTDPTRPAALLYAANGKGGVRLVGAEWFVVDEDQDPATHNAVIPTMFGREFDGPMPGHGPGMPVHYDLHAYLWQGNPAGVLDTWNEHVRCHEE